MAPKLRIRADSSQPIFEQIVGGIEQWILSENVKEGDFLPSVRELAVQISINPNTVAKAYLALQERGWVESVRGTGLRVRKHSGSRLEGRKQEILNTKVKELLATAKDLGIGVEDVIAEIKKLRRDVA